MDVYLFLLYGITQLSVYKKQFYLDVFYQFNVWLYATQASTDGSEKSMRAKSRYGNLCFNHFLATADWHCQNSHLFLSLTYYECITHHQILLPHITYWILKYITSFCLHLMLMILLHYFLLLFRYLSITSFVDSVLVYSLLSFVMYKIKSISAIEENAKCKKN